MTTHLVSPIPLATPLAAATGVGPLVVGSVLLAAVLHATWNALAHAISDRLVGFALIGVATTLGALPLVVAAPLPAAASWPALLASAVLHVVYNLLLMRSYRLGEFGQVYPLARGTSPLLVAVAGVVLVGEDLPLVRFLGVVVISLGLASLVLVGGVPTRAARPALVAAVLTGVSIAAYTTVDGVGVRSAGTVLGYTGWLFLLQGPALPVVAVLARRRALWSQVRPHLVRGLLGGLLSLAAYGLVLWAQTRGALAAVAALRETSVVVGAVIGAVVFGERFGRWRVAATVLVALGVVLVTL